MSTQTVNDTQLSLQQQTFALSLLSNIFDMASLSVEVQARTMLQNYIDTYVNARAANGENWVVEWGPVGRADTVNPDVPENTIYVAKNTTSGTDYVVAIAGTKGGSHFDVFDEDAKSNLTNFQVTPDHQFVISQGTIDGVNILLDLRDENGTYLIGSGTDNGFLPGQTGAGKAITITVTGHSLGGALSPALALTMFYTREQDGTLAGSTQGSWDRKGVAAVSFLETAGAAVGNQDYVDQLLQACPTGQAVWNCIDIVPHAWWSLKDSQGLCNSTPHKKITNIKDIYTPYTNDPNYAASGRLALAIDAIELKQTAQHVPINASPTFSGAFQEITIPGSCDLNNNIYYVCEILHQHIDAYCSYFNCTDLFNNVFGGASASKQSACGLLKRFYPESDCTCLT